MIVTVLIENKTDSELQAEHGLSLLIRTEGGRTLLLDSGASGLFLENAEALGEDLREVEACFLSHGHYDHAGGFAEFLKKYPGPALYMMKGAEAPCYSGRGLSRHGIGIPAGLFPEYRDRIHFTEGVTEIFPGVTLVPHSTPGLEEKGKRFVMRRRIGRRLVWDDFSHEMSLVIEEAEGLTVFNSCSHGGLPAILQEVSRAFPGKKIRNFVGGLHMMGKKDGEEICTFSGEEVREMARILEGYGSPMVYTGHCTGLVGYGLLEAELKDRVSRLVTGRVLHM